MLRGRATLPLGSCFARDLSDADFRPRQMAWHMGHPLSQSLFSSFYIDRLLWPEPNSPEEARFDREGKIEHENPLVHIVLRAYCIALIKTCAFVYQTICPQHFYEASSCQPFFLHKLLERRVLIPAQEEDFVSNLYHRKLLPIFEAKDVQSLLEQAIDYVHQQQDLRTGGFRDALISRLAFRKGFLNSVAQKFDINQSRSWEDCLRELPILLRTRPLGIPVQPAFSATIQRRLASTIPPRPIVEISFEQAHEHLRRTCQYIGEVDRFRDYYGGSNLLVCQARLL